MRTRGTTTTAEGITWYYEQEGTGPDVVLVPDGLGECQMFDGALSRLAARGFRATTFDMPGMSRSAAAPRAAYEDVTAQKLAAYVASVTAALGIGVDGAPPAAFWGCSSGGAAVLALVAGYPERVRCALVHEVPTYHMEDLVSARELGDDDAVAASLAASVPAGSYARGGDLRAWFALGGDAHARLWRNYPRWARGYPRTIPPSSPTAPEDLARRPLYWTVGADTPASRFLDNVVTAAKNGIDVGCLPGMHFPYVSHPDAFVKHVADIVSKHL
ncbi:putative zearalenone lactonohydrolase [Rosellinia necatrix]|uniref:Putative zearalenone lactonohydrolase n=1 Tax=Rosellinia necatrix TaxID=77044 RepID=A0A1W2TNW3_ROSNE|nr:putative zearalenone lactonohydrolase [Rosellinia necatrix]